MLRCTHISIPQAEHTYSVVLSKPAWMWGCEIGANERGVVGGNEAVSSLLAHELGTEPRLIGMDLLRLALERGGTAQEAVDVLTTLLEAHGQGGPCEDGGDWTYENGFILADASEAFVVETAGVHHWAVERVPPGKGRNISNGLSIRAAMRCSAGLKERCQEEGWWDGEGVFDFKNCVEGGGRRAPLAKLELYGRERAGAEHVAVAARRLADGTLAANDAQGWMRWMMGALRDEDSGIAFRETHGFMSTGSQVSWVPLATPATAASHLFTAASDPVVACYKRFTFPLAGPAKTTEATKEAGGSEGKSPSTVANNMRSLELWQKWRAIDLGGGLERRAASKAAAKQLREAMGALEENGVLGAATPTTSTSSGQGLPQDVAVRSFGEAVDHELELLEAATAA